MTESNIPKNIKKDWWLPLLSIVSWGALLLLLPKLPEQIPMHWGIDGTINRWGPKSNLLWLGLLPVGVWILLTWLPAIDPGRANYRKFGKSYRLIRGVVVVMMIGLAWLAVAASKDKNFDTILLIQILLGLLFVILGNALSRIRPSWFVGIRTRWTLGDPVIWQKTHRLAGFIMVFGGLTFIVSALLIESQYGFWIPMAVLLGGFIIDVIYSAFLWKKLHGKNSVPRMSKAQFRDVSKK